MLLEPVSRTLLALEAGVWFQWVRLDAAYASLRNPVREIRTQGSDLRRGASGNGCPYLNVPGILTLKRVWASCKLPLMDTVESIENAVQQQGRDDLPSFPGMIVGHRGGAVGRSNRARYRVGQTG